MSRKSGYRFYEKVMRHSTSLERVPIRLERDALYSAAAARFRFPPPPRGPSEPGKISR
jgi:hypothetical protein